MNNTYIVVDLIQLSVITGAQNETSHSENYWKQQTYNKETSSRRRQSNTCAGFCFGLDLLDSWLKISDILEQKLIEKLKDLMLLI